MIAPQQVGFEHSIALVLYVIKEAHPNSKMTYYRFPKEKAKYSFDPKSEFSVQESVRTLSIKWRKHTWDKVGV